MVDRVRARFSKTSPSFRRCLVAGVILLFLVIIMSIELSSFGYLVAVGKPSSRTVGVPRTVQYDHVRVEYHIGTGKGANRENAGKG
jgi:hypothetical protein